MRKRKTNTTLFLYQGPYNPGREAKHPNNSITGDSEQRITGSGEKRGRKIQYRKGHLNEASEGQQDLNISGNKTEVFTRRV